MLTKNQRHQISGIINSIGLNHLDFYPEDVDSIKTENFTALKLKYKDTPYYFHFDLYYAKHWIMFSPAEDRLEKTAYPGDWKTTIHYFIKWLEYLITEINIPDVWGEYLKYGRVVSNVDSDNSLFSEEEIRLIEIKIGITKNNVSKLSISEDEKKEIVDKLDYIYEKSKLIGRLDWRSLFIGYILQLALPPENLKLVINLIGQAFNAIFLKQ